MYRKWFGEAVVKASETLSPDQIQESLKSQTIIVDAETIYQHLVSKGLFPSRPESPKIDEGMRSGELAPDDSASQQGDSETAENRRSLFE